MNWGMHVKKNVGGDFFCAIRQEETPSNCGGVVVVVVVVVVS